MLLDISARRTVSTSWHLRGLSTEREPSAAEVAALITQIRQAKVKAVFMENIKDARLLKQIADESGAHIGGTLYSDALAAKRPCQHVSPVCSNTTSTPFTTR
jgi:ABC-type Zn uptake system ZnuABC Zn-binding protein ZnuA